MEQQHRLATMRVLGVHNKEISVSWLLQSILQYVIAAIAGLPAGAVAAQVILHPIQDEKFRRLHGSLLRHTVIMSIAYRAAIITIP